MKCVIYTRVSSEDQVAGASPDMQKVQCQAMATATGMEVGEVIFDDGYSGKDLKRPGMQKILALVAAGKINGIIVWKLDRLTRSLRDLLQLADLFTAKGVALVSLQEKIDTSGPMGRFTLSLMGALAHLERETIAGRVKAAMDHIRAQGGWAGGPTPPGTRVEGARAAKRLVRDDRTAPAVAAAFGAYRGGASLAVVAQRLLAAGIDKRLRTPTNVAVLLRNKHLVAAGVVDRGTFDEVAKLLVARRTGGATVTARTKQQRVWPLHGLAFCGACGSALIGASARGRSSKHHYLRCAARNRRTCKQPELPAEAWEQAVCDAVVRASKDGKWTAAWASYVERITAGGRDAIQRRDAVTGERGKLKTKLERLLDMIAEGDAPGKVTLERVKEFEGKIAACDHQLDVLAGELAAVDLLEQRRDAMVEAIKKGRRSLSLENPAEAHEILSGLISRVTLQGEPAKMTLELFVPGPDGGPWFVQNTRLVEDSGGRTNQGPTLSYPLTVTRSGQAYSVRIAEDSVDLEPLKAWLRTADTRAAAARLGCSERHIRRLRVGDIGGARLLDLACAFKDEEYTSATTARWRSGISPGS